MAKSFTYLAPRICNAIVLLAL